MIKINNLTENEVNFFLNEGYLVFPGLLFESDAAKLQDEVMGIMNVIKLENSKLRQTTQYLKGEHSIP